MATDTRQRRQATSSTGRPWSDVAIPPGETLAETLASLGLSQAELARRAQRPVQAINEIVRGKKEITAETALAFERVLGVPAHVWIRLEGDYRLTAARLKLEAGVARNRASGLGVRRGTGRARMATAPKRERARTK